MVRGKLTCISSMGRATFSASGHGAQQGAALVEDTELREDPLVGLIVIASDISSPSMNHLAGTGPDQADHVLEQGALAATASPQDDEDLPFVHLEGDVVQDHHLPRTRPPDPRPDMTRRSLPSPFLPPVPARITEKTESVRMIRKMLLTTAEVVACPTAGGASPHLKSPEAPDPGDEEREDHALSKAPE